MCGFFFFFFKEKLFLVLVLGVVLKKKVDPACTVEIQTLLSVWKKIKKDEYPLVCTVGSDCVVVWDEDEAHKLL